MLSYYCDVYMLMIFQILPLRYVHMVRKQSCNNIEVNSAKCSSLGCMNDVDKPTVSPATQETISTPSCVHTYSFPII